MKLETQIDSQLDSAEILVLNSEQLEQISGAIGIDCWTLTTVSNSASPVLCP